MANILMSYFAELGEPMYDAVAETLLKNGNNVFRLNINNPSVAAPRWGETSRIKDGELLKKICDFEPEIILNYNNSLPVNVYSSLNCSFTDCIIDADSINYFWNEDRLKETRDEHLYLGQQSASKPLYDKYIGTRLDDEHYLYFPGATVINNRNEEQNKNISFIGTNFHLIAKPECPDYYSKDALEIHQKLSEDFFYDVSKLKEEHPGVSDVDMLSDLIKTSLAGQERIKYLQAICDLGLTIYGVRWEQAAYIDFELARCFDKTPVTTLEQNEYIYNSSKVSVNISHPQASTSFSWRVMDIMASNSCLATECKKDWVDLFGDYLSDETMHYAVYSDRYDFRKKCIELLQDDDLRIHCVSEMNKAIEENGRWESRFLALEERLGIRIVGNHNDSQEYVWIKGEKKQELNEEQKTERYISRLLHNGMYKISHVPAIRYYLWDIIRP